MAVQVGADPASCVDDSIEFHLERLDLPGNNFELFSDAVIFWSPAKINFIFARVEWAVQAAVVAPLVFHRARPRVRPRRRPNEV